MIISNGDGAHLLGHRVNRIAHDELGCSSLLQANIERIGIYDHRYEDNPGGEPSISMDYVVMGYKRRGKFDLVSLPNAQPTAYRWATADAIIADQTIRAKSSMRRARI
ncbi:hypothetical protein [Burkholderia diffusa]|uniref:hypothetical protein n=1 Tax=Burkholderia diffusa TaxID=488732 RepID=UPI002ABE724D|nr:hypothetical protein [Burkholderia diffusa]